MLSLRWAGLTAVRTSASAQLILRGWSGRKSVAGRPQSHITNFWSPALGCECGAGTPVASCAGVLPPTDAIWNLWVADFSSLVSGHRSGIQEGQPLVPVLPCPMQSCQASENSGLAALDPGCSATHLRDYVKVQLLGPHLGPRFLRPGWGPWALAPAPVAVVWELSR